MMDIAIFGSLYLDGVSVPHSPCPEYQKDQKIELGDGQPGAMLPWLCVGKKLIAAESCCAMLAGAAPEGRLHFRMHRYGSYPRVCGQDVWNGVHVPHPEHP